MVHVSYQGYPEAHKASNLERLSQSSAASLSLGNGSREIDHLHRASKLEQKTKIGAVQSGAVLLMSKNLRFG